MPWLQQADKLVQRSRAVSEMSGRISITYSKIPPSSLTKAMICFLLLHIHWPCGFWHLQKSIQSLARTYNMYLWAQVWKLSSGDFGVSFVCTSFSRSFKDFSTTDYLVDNTYSPQYRSFSSLFQYTVELSPTVNYQPNQGTYIKCLGRLLDAFVPLLCSTLTFNIRTTKQ